MRRNTHTHSSPPRISRPTGQRHEQEEVNFGRQRAGGRGAHVAEGGRDKRAGFARSLFQGINLSMPQFPPLQNGDTISP